MAQSGSDFSVVSLSAKQGTRFQQKEVVYIQQFYTYAPKYYLDDVARKEKALPAGVTDSIVRGKELPKALTSFLMDSPPTVTRNLGSLPRGFDRKVLGTRYLLLDSRMVVQDIIHLPTNVTSLASN